MRNINVKVVAQEKQNVLEGIFELRHDVCVNEKGVGPDFDNQMERDDYDQYT
jgi:hypothetical protein